MKRSVDLKLEYDINNQPNDGKKGTLEIFSNSNIR